MSPFLRRPDDSPIRDYLAAPAESRRSGKAWKIFRSWLLIGTVSMGVGALVALLFVLPWTVESWRDVEAELPAAIATASELRLLLVVAAIAVATIGAGALFFRMNTGLRIAINLFCTLALMSVVVAALLGWWMLYIDLMNQASTI